MDFRIKCFVQTIFSLLPNGEHLNYLAQKYVTKKLPPSQGTYVHQYGQALNHHKIFSAYKSSEDSVVYEIGCGWHLAMALAFSTFGYASIKALDVTNHVRAELINTILQYFKEDGKFGKDHLVIFDSDNIKQKIYDAYRIDLLIPGDSAHTGLEDQSVDFIYSQAVFEHISPELLPAIMKECHRVLKDDGVISFCIDYKDHYSSFDKSITPYNFMRYSEKAWKKYNPPMHYVNRLRHIDFIRIFQQAGFDIVEETVFRPDDWEKQLMALPISKEFSERYTLDELSIVSAKLVLRKSQSRLPRG